VLERLPQWTQTEGITEYIRVYRNVAHQ
jgi:hypothetical protein